MNESGRKVILFFGAFFLGVAVTAGLCALLICTSNDSQVQSNEKIVISELSGNDSQKNLAAKEELASKEAKKEYDNCVKYLKKFYAVMNSIAHRRSDSLPSCAEVEMAIGDPSACDISIEIGYTHNRRMAYCYCKTHKIKVSAFGVEREAE
jgi:hypothetical protein